ncbi:MAG: ECF transporter S component [Clostridia bacterium]|nr:ECF transporter S component [Clostridia bacterium]
MEANRPEEALNGQTSVEVPAGGPARSRSNRDRLIKLTVTAMLTALIVLMAFTPIGYLRLGALSITFIMVPVVVGAITVGPAAGAFLGGVFGVTSFIQCFTGDLLGSILAAESIPKTVVLCIGSRILAGWLAGLIFKALAPRDKKSIWSSLVAALSGSLFNTLFFLGLLALLFMRTEFTAEQAEALGGLTNVLNTVIAIAASVNAPIEAAVCAVLGAAVSKAVFAARKQFSR